MALMTLYGMKEILLGNIHLLTDDIRVMLLDADPTIDHLTVQTINQVSGDQVVGSGYTAGGFLLANKSISIDTTNNRAEFHADPATWDPSTISAQWYVIYQDSGTPTTSPIVAVHNYGMLKSSIAGPFTLTEQAAPGMISLTLASSEFIFFEPTLDGILAGDIDFVADTLKWALLAEGSAPDVNSHDFFADMTAMQVVGTGYTSGGVTLASPAITIDTTNNLVKFTSATPARWSSSDITNARYGVLYKDTGSAATSPLIGLYDFTTPRTSVASTFDLNMHADGWIRFLNTAA